MNSAATKDRLVPAYIECGQVIDVDIEAYTVSVVTEFTRKIISAIPFATPYQHPSNGEGVYFMPEVGSLVWICVPSDGGRPFVISWRPVREDSDSLRANKLALNPGDIYLGTRDENFLILRRGGVVQVGGGPLSQRMFLPVTNTIKDICENYSLISLGGDLEWSIQREEFTTDGRRPALLRLAAREFANDEVPIAILEIGSHPSSSANILSLIINASGQKGAAKKIGVELRKDGSASFTFESDVEMETEGTFSVRAQQELKLYGKAKAVLEGGVVQVLSTTGMMELKALTNIAITAGAAVSIGPRLIVGGGGAGTAPALLGSSAFLTWLLTHSHPVVAVGHPTGPPNKPTTSDYLAKTLFGR